MPPPPGILPKPVENAWPGFEQKKPTAVQAFDDGGWDDDDWNLDDDFDAKPPPPKKPIELEEEEDFDDFDNNASFDDADYMKGIDINSKAYQNENLNKLGDDELARRKR